MTDNIDAIRMLWANVIIQSCADIEEGIRHQKKHGDYNAHTKINYHRDFVRRNYRAAIKWIFSESQEFGSLRWICEILDADMYAIREHVAQEMIAHGYRDDLRIAITMPVAA